MLKGPVATESHCPAPIVSTGDLTVNEVYGPERDESQLVRAALQPHRR